jgi:hypothetical protein
MTRKDALWIALGSLSALGLGYFVYWLNKRPGGVTAAIQSAAQSVTNVVSGQGSDSTTSDASFPLKRGSKGRQVVALQKFLNASDSSNKLTTDGNFGPITEAAWKKEQAPFATFKSMYPDAIEGQVTRGYYDTFVYTYDELYGEKGYK